MKISDDTASQIAALLNSQNQLTVSYSLNKILENQNQYIVKNSDDEYRTVIGVVRVKQVQWYQCEISHLSVRPESKRQGVGEWLIDEAEIRARELGARIVQCTIRNGNIPSENLFKKQGYIATVNFENEQNGNIVTVYQKTL